MFNAIKGWFSDTWKECQSATAAWSVCLMMMMLFALFSFSPRANAQPETAKSVPQAADTQAPAPVEDSVPMEPISIDEVDEVETAEESIDVDEGLVDKAKNVWGSVVNKYNTWFHGASVTSEYVDPEGYIEVSSEGKQKAVTSPATETTDN